MLLTMEYKSEIQNSGISFTLKVDIYLNNQNFYKNYTNRCNLVRYN